MEQSQYIDLIKSYFPSLTSKVLATLNNTTNPAINARYRHREMLTKQFSVDNKWEALTTSNGSAVAADVIAMDSSIPLKMRDSISKYNGDIPKLGQELALRETQLTQLDILARNSNQTTQLIAKIYQDTPRVIKAVYETLEYMFLQALSTGVTAVQDPNNVGTGIRIDYGYLSANKFGTVGAVWSNTAATPLTDLARLQAKATTDGNAPTRFMMDRTTFNRMVATAEAKGAYAAFIGNYGTNQQTPTLSQFNQALQDRYGYTIEIVERSVTFERDGTRTPLIPWGAGQIVGLNTDNVGSLTWGTLAEMNRPVAGVNYQTVEDFILVSNFRLNRPSLMEVTNSQALVVPVIDGVNAIYTLDTLTVQA
jgi:hypothetical protein